MPVFLLGNVMIALRRSREILRLLKFKNDAEFNRRSCKRLFKNRLNLCDIKNLLKIYLNFNPLLITHRKT